MELLEFELGAIPKEAIPREENLIQQWLERGCPDRIIGDGCFGIGKETRPETENAWGSQKVGRRGRCWPGEIGDRGSPDLALALPGLTDHRQRGGIGAGFAKRCFRLARHAGVLRGRPDHPLA